MTTPINPQTIFNQNFAIVERLLQMYQLASDLKDYFFMGKYQSAGDKNVGFGNRWDYYKFSRKHWQISKILKNFLEDS